MVSFWSPRQQKNYDDLLAWAKPRGRTPLAQDDARAKYYRQMLPIISDLDRGWYNLQSAEKYMADNGLTWDTVDPIKLAGHFNPSTAYRGAVSMLYVSKNLARFYR